MRILLVEDEAPLRETLAARLKREGYAVDAAQDGEEGLYMGKEVPFDVGIIDLGLPKMSGMELIRALRAEGKKFPILILTARSSWQDKVDGLKQGADDYLVKPFHVEELLARINALVRRAAGWSKPTLECGPVVLDLAAQTVTTPTDEVFRFEVDPERKHRLLNGLDDISLTLQHTSEIQAYEARRKLEAPWLFA